MAEAEVAAAADAVDNVPVPTVPTVTPAQTDAGTSGVAVWVALAGLMALAAGSLLVWRKMRSR